MTEPAPLPSNRSFGTVFVVFFTLLGAWSWWRGGDRHLWWFALSALVLLFTLLAPGLLTPFNRAWMKLGDLLNRIVSPLVLGVMFYGLITPIALAMRLAGRDSLYRQFDAQTESYWVKRDPPGPDPESLKQQF